jgi:rubredoxin
LDIGVLGYIGILYHKEHPPEVWHIPPGTPVYSHPSTYVVPHLRHLPPDPRQARKLVLTMLKMSSSR